VHGNYNPEHTDQQLQNVKLTIAVPLAASVAICLAALFPAMFFTAVAAGMVHAVGQLSTGQ
jgi:hypothetical protein